MITIGVIGLGVIGGSLALSAQRARHQVVCWDSDPPTRDAAAADGLMISSDLSAADLLVLAAPMPALTEGLAATIAGLVLPDTATITDVGSLKTPVAAAMDSAGLSARYIGGHPMAGSEGSGFDEADPDLLTGARWALCLTGNETDLRRWLEVAAMVTSLGAAVVPITPAEHDNAMGTVSGVPHLLALALAAAAQLSGPFIPSLAAGSFADLTRVAGSSPTLLHAVTEENEPAVRAALRLVQEQLERPWAELIEDGHAARELLGGGHPPRLLGTYPTETTVSGAEDLLRLGRVGAMIEAVQPGTGTVWYRGAPPR